MNQKENRHAQTDPLGALPHSLTRRSTATPIAEAIKTLDASTAVDRSFTASASLD